MLQYQTVSPGTIALIRQLMCMPEIDPFVLVGGTSLSLQLGHRISIDLDFFTDKSFDIDSLRIALSTTISNFEILRISNTGFSCYAGGIKCDFYNWAVPFIEKPIIEDGIRLGSLKDIAAFKLDAISGRKEKKDFWDIDSLLNHFSLAELLSFHQMKFIYINGKVVLDALSEIDLADNSEDPNVILPGRWDEIKQRIKEKWIQYINEKLNRKEEEKHERLKRAEELLKNKKTKP